MTKFLRNSLFVFCSCLLMLCIGLGVFTGFYNINKANAEGEPQTSFSRFSSLYNHHVNGDIYENELEYSPALGTEDIVTSGGICDAITINGEPLSSFGGQVGTRNKGRLLVTYSKNSFPQFSAEVTQIKMELTTATVFGGKTLQPFTFYLNDETKKWQPGVYTYTPSVEEVMTELLENKFTTEEGASVRIANDGHNGLRFENRCDYSAYNTLKTTYGEENIVLGTYIVPKAFLTSSGKSLYEFVTTQEPIVAGVTKYLDLSTHKGDVNIFFNEATAETVGYYTFYGSITDIKYINYINEFIGVGYVRVTVNENTYTFLTHDGTSDNNCRTIYQVAKSAYADTKRNYTETQLSVIKSYIDKVIVINEVEGNPALDVATLKRGEEKFSTINYNICYEDGIYTITAVGEIANVVVDGKILGGISAGETRYYKYNDSIVETPTDTEKNIQAISLYQDENVFLTNDLMTEWLKTYTLASSQPYSDLDKSLTQEYYYPIESVTLSWSDGLNCDYYIVLIYSNEDVKSAKTYQVVQCEKTITDLLPSVEYYWQVVGFKNNQKVVVSDIFHFTTASTPRTIKVDGLSNTRDIGGYMTSYGKKVKHGLIYRSGGTENTTDLGRQQIANFGIKTEIDLRGVREHYKGTEFYNSGDKKVVDACLENGSWLGADVEYKPYWCPWYAYNDGMSLNDTLDTYYHPAEMAHFNDIQMVNIIREFANIDNYPIIFHCSAGRDRTGTVACIISALLGVNVEDLYIDYETSFFSYVGSNEKPNINTMVGYFTTIISYLNSFEGDTLADKTANYLMTYGITQQEIDAIRNIMLED